MSIENLKKIIESEKAEGIKQFWEFRAFKAGHEAATNRLLPLLQKAVEMAEFYKDIKPFPDDGKKAREFLLSLSETTESVSELTKTTEIKKEGV